MYSCPKFFDFIQPRIYAFANKFFVIGDLINYCLTITLNKLICVAVSEHQGFNAAGSNKFCNHFFRNAKTIFFCVHNYIVSAICIFSNIITLINLRKWRKMITNITMNCFFAMNGHHSSRGRIANKINVCKNTILIKRILRIIKPKS